MISSLIHRNACITSLQINLVAGGTGITPHWQLIHAILLDEDDETRIKIIDWWV